MHIIIYITDKVGVKGNIMVYIDPEQIIWQLNHCSIAADGLNNLFIWTLTFFFYDA